MIAGAPPAPGSSAPYWPRVVIIGVGLIGGSFALALRRARLAGEITGLGRDPESLRRAVELGLIDSASDLPEAAIPGSDLVVLAAPVAQSRAIFASIAPLLDPATIVTDAGSVKGDVIATARASLGGAIGQFVPGHPIAGGEAHGPAAAMANLFEGRRVILCPLEENSPAAVARVGATWEAFGAAVQTMTATEHDQLFAAVSHLPHLLAYALMAQIVASTNASQKLALAGSGFRDFTRIAASSSEMWTDISLGNRTALLKEIDQFSTVLLGMRDMIAAGDEAGLQNLFEVASRARQRWGGAA